MGIKSSYVISPKLLRYEDEELSVTVDNAARKRQDEPGTLEKSSDTVSVLLLSDCSL